jgi:hypothetical protein
LDPGALRSIRRFIEIEGTDEVSSERAKKDQKKVHSDRASLSKKVPKDSYWFKMTRLVHGFVDDLGINLNDFRKRFLDFNADRTPRYKIGFEHFRRVLQGKDRRPSYHRDFLEDIAEALSSLHPQSEQAEKLKYYRSQLLQADKSDSASQRSDKSDFALQDDAAKTALKKQLEVATRDFKRAGLAFSKPALYDFLNKELYTHGPIYSQPTYLKGMISQQTTQAPFDMPIAVTVLTRAGEIELSAPPNPQLGEHNIAANHNPHVKKLQNIAELTFRLHKFEHPDSTKTLDNFFYNGPTYTLKGISANREDTKCTITGGLSDYFSMLATHDATEFELLSALSSSVSNGGSSINRDHTLIKRMQFRKQKRHAALSISAIVAHRTSNSDNFKIMVLKRSNNVTISRALFHVIPAGMFQPAGKFPEDVEWNISHGLIKEYCEEFFDEKQNENAVYPTDIYSDWKSAHELYSELVEGQCKILHSGVVLNLINLLPEICCVLLVEDAGWYKTRKGRKTNHEWIPRQEIVSTLRRARTEFDLDEAEVQFSEAFENLTPTQISARWAPTGLACFWLGIQTVREHLKSKDKKTNKRPNMFVPFLD